jgi:hypothetical protein
MTKVTLAAGNPGYKAACNGGGMKKSGLYPQRGLASVYRSKQIHAYVSPSSRRKVWFLNQIGSIGRYGSQTSVPADGVNKKTKICDPKKSVILML